MRVSAFIFWVFLTASANDSLALTKLKIAANYYSDTPTASEIILRKAYNKIGYDIEVGHFPSARSIFLSSTGEYDAELQRRGSTAERFPNLIKISVPIHSIDIVAFGTSQTKTFNNWESLYPYNIGAVTGHTFMDRAIAEHPQLSYVKIVGPEQLLKMVSVGRIDYAILTKITGIKALRKLSINNVSMMGGTIESHQLYHFIHKKNEHLKPKLEETLKEMQRSGEIDKIRSEYFKSLGI